MTIKDVVTAVLDARTSSLHEFKQPELCIYMKTRFWYDCMSDPSSDIYGFLYCRGKELMGHPVFKVDDCSSHPDFRVVEL